MLGSTRSFVSHLIHWYRQHRRILPWRVSGDTAKRFPHPYYVLVSEAMLQQTQVATVIPYFNRFIDRFPTIESLAEAEEQEVLRLWQGLGYYSRARNLQRAARMVLSDHAGELPKTTELLLQLPGVGRYTAGAIASLAYGTSAPILDGNVTRVLCRLDKIESDPREKPTQAALWRRAEELLPSEGVGDFNSALMELGATICTPRAPKCLFCPVRSHCEAAHAGIQEQIPLPKKTLPTPVERRMTFCIRRTDGRYLIEQRPARGRWAGMWQFVTVVRGKGNKKAVLSEAIKSLPVQVRDAKWLTRLSHSLTHRQYRFEVFSCAFEADGIGPDENAPQRVWASLEEVAKYPLPKPHVHLAELLREVSATGDRPARKSGMLE